MSVVDDDFNLLRKIKFLRCSNVYRNPAPPPIPQSSNSSYSTNNQMPFQSQQIPHQLRQIAPQQPPQSALRTQNSSQNLLNLSGGLWPSTYKPAQPQNNINSAFNSNVINKPIFDPLPSYNQVRWTVMLFR